MDFISDRVLKSNSFLNKSTQFSFKKWILYEVYCSPKSYHLLIFFKISFRFQFVFKFSDRCWTSSAWHSASNNCTDHLGSSDFSLLIVFLPISYCSTRTFPFPSLHFSPSLPFFANVFLYLLHQPSNSATFSNVTLDLFFDILLIFPNHFPSFHYIPIFPQLSSWNCTSLPQSTSPARRWRWKPAVQHA